MKSRLQFLCERLAASPARGIGAADEVAAEAADNPSTLQDLVAALDDPREIVLRRASNALKKVQLLAARALDPFASKLLEKALACTVLEARWNLTIVAGTLQLPQQERALAIDLMFQSLSDARPFLRVFALQGLADLSGGDEALRRRVRPLLENALEDPSPAVRARARKLLKTSPTQKS